MADDKNRPAVGVPLHGPVGRQVPGREFRWSDLVRSAMPVRCEICEWRGRRLVARSKPCPACGSRVEFA